MAGHGSTVLRAQHVRAFPATGAMTASPYARAARVSHARHRPPRPAQAATAPPSESRGRTRLRLNAPPRVTQLARMGRGCPPRSLHCRHSAGIVNRWRAMPTHRCACEQAITPTRSDRRSFMSSVTGLSRLPANNAWRVLQRSSAPTGVRRNNSRDSVVAGAPQSCASKPSCCLGSDRTGGRRALRR